MESVPQIDIDIIESIRRVFSITKQLPPISGLYLLQKVGAVEQISQQELAEQLRMKPQSVSEHLKKMEASGVITRKPSPMDKRVTLVRITDTGRQEIASSEARFRTHTEAFLSNFNDQEKAELARLLQKMIDTNEGKTPALTPRPQTHQTPAEADREASNETENRLICTCRGRRCVITWDDAGRIEGHFCRIGLEGARETIRQQQERA